MRIRRFVLVALLAACFAPFGRDLAPAAIAQQPIATPWAVASETTYRIDTANGRITAHMHGEYQNVSNKDIAAIPVFIMPAAENVVVKSGDAVLATTITPGDEAAAVAGNALSTLPAPLKPNLRIVLDATYDIAPRSGKVMTLEAGLIETPLIGQGKGSFVLIDVPEGGDNYFDPGCLLASSQPKDVKADGLVRWVCGEVTLIAVNSDDPDIVRSCAAMDDKCRQRTDIRVFSAYAQSITDSSKAGKLEGDVTMPDGRTVHMVLKYFKREQSWADKQWEIAQKAFPRLEAVFGFQYPLNYVNMRQSHHIERLGAAGIAFNKGGEVLLAVQGDVNFDSDTTIHELAHQWSLYRHFESSFMVEGLAVYATNVLLPEFGIAHTDTGWQSFPVSYPLLTWENNLGELGPYFYGRSGAFWAAYETAVGGRENMTAILGRIDDEQSLWPLEAGWFMDQGEWVSNKNLDAVFSEWVFNATSAKALLEQRRASHNLVRELQARATTFGLSGMPSDIYDNLLAWVFDPVAGQVAKANKVLDSYAEVAAMSTEAGLGTPEGVARAWGNKKVSETLGVVEEQRQAILAITNAAKELADEPEDSTAKQRLNAAREAYAAGDFAGAKSAAAGGITAAYNEVAAGKMIRIAREKQKSFSPNFFGRIGMYFTDADGDLAAAEEALEAGDGTAALKLARGAYDTWDGASQRGIQRLAMFAGLMCALSFGVWFLLKRLDGPSAPAKKPGQGHFLEESTERRSSWRDWENTP